MKTEPNRVKFTPPRIQAFACPFGKKQAFLWDTEVRGLGLRVTDKGVKAYVLERKLGRRTVRMTIGSPTDWPLDSIWEDAGAGQGIRQVGARSEARKLLSTIDTGTDPRQEKKKRIAADQADRALAKAERLRQELTGLQAWENYRSARASRWGELGRHDHEVIVQAGGAPRLRSKAKVTQPGPLRKLLDRPLAQLDGKVVSAWLATDAARRPAVAGKSFRMLRAFVNWCGEHDDYKAVVQRDCCASKKTRALLPKPKAKQDSLEREQLSSWFAEVRKISNPVIAAYLQVLLLTGARREEVLSLQWDDVDFQWNRMSIKDKVEGRRDIPLTPYVAFLLNSLPRLKKNPWVFSSPAAKSGRLQEPRLNHNKALVAADLPHITLHGLRRSFGSLAEWLEAPVGIIAQIQGHKPSALVEKHYRVRPMDLLRQWHRKLEEWILREARIEFDPSHADRPLRLVAAAA